MIDYDSFSHCYLTDIFFRYFRWSERVNQSINYTLFLPKSAYIENKFDSSGQKIDRFTRFLTVVPMRDCTAQSVVDAFLHGYVSYCFGELKVNITDRGAQFDFFLFTGLLNFWVVSVNTPPATTLNLMVW